MMYTLTNDFHNTAVTVRVRALSHIHDEIELPLTQRQITRAKRALCGFRGCTCANTPAGMRGAQIDPRTGKRIVVDFSALY